MTATLVGHPSPASLSPTLQFLSLLRQDLIRDLLFLWNPREQAFHTLMSVGMDVCGHPSIVHGGFTSGTPPSGPVRRPGQTTAGMLPAWFECAVCLDRAWHLATGALHLVGHSPAASPGPIALQP